MDTAFVSASEWRTSINICRCCLVKGCYKDIAAIYYYLGQKEVYEDMLNETFNIQISQHESGGPIGGGRFICDNCITQLRNAFTFKRMVLRSEQTVTEYSQGLHSLEDNAETSNSEANVEPIKIEPVQDAEINFSASCEDIQHVTNHDNFDEDEVLRSIKMELDEVGDGDIDLEPVLKRSGRKRLKSSRSSSKRSKIKNGDDALDKQTLKNSQTKEDLIKVIQRRGNGPILRKNSLKLLANSTMCVFQWNKSRYRCFCCKEPFSDMNSLREHTEKSHTIQNIEKKIISQQNRLVKVEVSVLRCRICDGHLENLDNLRSHLTDAHQIRLDMNEDLLVPFKIGNGELQCQICSESFALFRLLNMHMNRHYQKQVCHICGAGFSNLVFLNLHKTRIHRPLVCKMCNMVFSNKLGKRQHDVSVHNFKAVRKLRYPCRYCNERFFQENKRLLHLIEKHGLSKPEHKCILCQKVFITKSLRNSHMKSVHLKERSHECDVCHNKFYGKSDLTRHKVTHTGEKKFSCTWCNALFSTKDSLRRHMKKSHVAIH